MWKQCFRETLQHFAQTASLSDKDQRVLFSSLLCCFLFFPFAARWGLQPRAPPHPQTDSP